MILATLFVISSYTTFPYHFLCYIDEISIFFCSSDELHITFLFVVKPADKQEVLSYFIDFIINCCFFFILQM